MVEKFCIDKNLNCKNLFISSLVPYSFKTGLLMYNWNWNFQGAVTDIYDDGVLIQFEDGWVNLLLHIIRNPRNNKIIWEILLQFRWQKESKFPFDQVRLPPSETVQDELFTENMEVEVFSRSNDNEACGWWRAVIKVWIDYLKPLRFSWILNEKILFQMMRGEFLVVEYCGWENSFTEIVGLERMRHKNLNPPIDIKTFYKFEVNVPDELRE